MKDVRLKTTGEEEFIDLFSSLMMDAVITSHEMVPEPVIQCS